MTPQNVLIQNIVRAHTLYDSQPASAWIVAYSWCTHRYSTISYKCASTFPIPFQSCQHLYFAILEILRIAFNITLIQKYFHNRGDFQSCPTIDCFTCRELYCQMLCLSFASICLLHASCIFFEFVNLLTLVEDHVYLFMYLFRQSSFISVLTNNYPYDSKVVKIVK